jgi:DNA (cytosine-5)-methyltransferase 1
LQGFDANWTFPIEQENKQHGRRRWRLIGNAVSVPVAAWVARRIAQPGEFDRSLLRPMIDQSRWPTAACGSSRARHVVSVSEAPYADRHPHLHNFLQYPSTPLSERAAGGFFQRVRCTTLKLEDGFLEALAIAAGLDRSQAVRIAPKKVATERGRNSGRRGRQGAEKRTTA